MWIFTIYGVYYIIILFTQANPFVKLLKLCQLFQLLHLPRLQCNSNSLYGLVIGAKVWLKLPWFLGLICDLSLSLRPGADAPTHTGQQWEDNVSIVSGNKSLTDLNHCSGPPQCPLLCDRHWEAGLTRICDYHQWWRTFQVNEQWAQDLIQEVPIKMVATRIVSEYFLNCIHHHSPSWKWMYN